MITKLKQFLSVFTGPRGIPGMQGPQGRRGESAYEIFKRHNPESTLTEYDWVNSLRQHHTPIEQFFAKWVASTWNQLPEDERDYYLELYKLGNPRAKGLAIKGVIDQLSELPEGAEVGDGYFYQGNLYVLLETGYWDIIGDLTQVSGATQGSAGIDLRAITIDTQDDDSVFSRSNDYEIAPGEVISVHTGLSIWIKDPHLAGFILPRSGLGSKHGIVLGNLVGLIDSDYQGELIVTLWNRSDKPFKLTKGDRIAQYLVVPRISFNLTFSDEYVEETQRGDGGFGSTGTR